MCKKNVVGRRCDRCAPGTYGFGPNGCLGKIMYYFFTFTKLKSMKITYLYINVYVYTLSEFFLI